MGRSVLRKIPKLERPSWSGVGLDWTRRTGIGDTSEKTGERWCRPEPRQRLRVEMLRSMKSRGGLWLALP